MEGALSFNRLPGVISSSATPQRPHDAYSFLSPSRQPSKSKYIGMFAAVLTSWVPEKSFRVLSLSGRALFLNLAFDRRTTTSPRVELILYSTMTAPSGSTGVLFRAARDISPVTDSTKLASSPHRAQTCDPRSPNISLHCAHHNGRMPRILKNAGNYGARIEKGISACAL